MSDAKAKVLGTWALGSGLAEKAAKKSLKRMQSIEEQTSTGRRGRKEENRKKEK